ncbi:MAG: L-2-hydroxyglutarate oxidase, partial [Nocardia sp.]|nr:L-2-hydroxyglutarate oxidase [Nocardia sp.]
MPEETIAIIGAGILGLAIGREITLRRPGARVVVVDKENRVAAHQTGHNSGVVHAGIYYEPGSLKATLCARGRALLREYCAEKGLPYQEAGKLVVAVTPEDVPRMDALAERAGANGVPGLRRIDAAEIAAIEPYATGLAALYSPHTAITDFSRVAEAFAADITASGGQVRLSFPVTSIRPHHGRIEIGSPAEVFEAHRVVICAGLHGDAVAALAGDEPGPRIMPFRGEYMLIRPEKADMVRGLIYPVPDPRYPFLGVHFTRRVDGSVDIGPNAVLAF